MLLPQINAGRNQRRRGLSNEQQMAMKQGERGVDGML